MNIFKIIYKVTKKKRKNKRSRKKTKRKEKRKKKEMEKIKETKKKNEKQKEKKKRNREKKLTGLTKPAHTICGGARQDLVMPLKVAIRNWHSNCGNGGICHKSVKVIIGLKSLRFAL